MLDSMINRIEMWVNDSTTSDGIEINGKLKGGEIHGDHVFPRSKGGKTVVENGKLRQQNTTKRNLIKTLLHKMGKDSTMERMSINYKYNEQELISQFKEYVDKTYEQHYSKDKFQSN